MWGKSSSISSEMLWSSSCLSGENHGVMLPTLLTRLKNSSDSCFKVCGNTNNGSCARNWSDMFWRTQQNTSRSFSPPWSLLGMRSSVSSSSPGGNPADQFPKCVFFPNSNHTKQTSAKHSCKTFFDSFYLSFPLPSRGTKVKDCGIFFFSNPALGFRSL